MITIHGVPLSVHTRKAIVTAILKKIDYGFEVVIADTPPPNWRKLSPTGADLRDAGWQLHPRGF